MNRPNSRTWTIIIAVVALAALLLLASSLNELSFAEGTPLPVENMAPDLGASNDTTQGLTDTLIKIFRVAMIVAWVLLPFYVIYLIISKEARKKFLRDMAMIIPLLLLLYFFSESITNRPGEETELAEQFGLQSAQEQQFAQSNVEMPVFSAPPAWVTTVASIILASLVVLIVFLVVMVIWRRTRRMYYQPRRRIAQQAQAAIDSIEAGGDLREVIQRCYQQMLVALSQYRLINREQYMTPHEFEELLERHGMPREPVRQLTDLFERVRYGEEKPGRQEERAAIASLSAIVSACQSTVQNRRAGDTIKS